MYAIKEHSRSIRGVKIPTFSRVIEGSTLLYVEAGTNGFRGGDPGAGATPWTAAYQAPPSMGFSRLEWVAIAFSMQQHG